MNKRKGLLPRRAPFRGFMKTIAIVLAIVWTTTAMTPAQDARSDSAVAARIRELEYARFDAQRRKDNLTLDAMLDNALIWVDPDGVQRTKADYLASLRLAGVNVIEIRPASMSVRVLGNTAVVSGIYHEKGVKSGRPYLLRARFINTWAFKNGKWVLIAATATSAIS